MCNKELRHRWVLDQQLEIMLPPLITRWNTNLFSWPNISINLNVVFELHVSTHAAKLQWRCSRRRRKPRFTNISAYNNFGAVALNSGWMNTQFYTVFSDWKESRVSPKSLRIIIFAHSHCLMGGWTHNCIQFFSDWKESHVLPKSQRIIILAQSHCIMGGWTHNFITFNL